MRTATLEPPETETPRRKLAISIASAVIRRTKRLAIGEADQRFAGKSESGEGAPEDRNGLPVYRRASQILLRAWLFRIARNALGRHPRRPDVEFSLVGRTMGQGQEDAIRRSKQQQAPTEASATAAGRPATAAPACELLESMVFLDSPDRDALMLRLLEHWDDDKIAGARDIPVGVSSSQSASAAENFSE